MSLLEGVAGAEALHHRAVLAQLLSLHEEAARLQLGFRRSLNQLGSSEREAAALRALGAAEVDSRRVQPPWGPIRSAFPRLFLGWLDLAQKVWAGEAAQAPPLAILLYRRALHFAVRSVLVPSLRAGRGSAEAGARARSLLLKYFLPLSRGRWDALPHWARQDLLEVTGLLRRSQQGLDKAWIASALEAPTETVCRMIRMSYFDVADRFIQRSIEQRTSSEGALRLSQGRCLREREHFSEARRAFDQAVAADVKGAREARVQALLDQGDLEAAERELEAVIPKTAAAWRAQSRLYRLLGQGDDAYEAARRALRAEPGEPSPQTLVAIGRGAALAGRFAEARASFRQAAGGQGEVAYEARERWARLESSMGRPRAALDAAWPLTMEPDPIARVAGSAMIAVAAARLAMPALVQLQIQRALYHADGDPRALLRLALILSEGGRGQLAALGALRDAIGLRPGWSVLYAQQAMILGQLRRLPEALEAIRVALRIRGAFPPYRALEAALLKLAASSRGEILDQTPKWAGKDDAESGPDGGSPAPAGPASPVTPPARHATVADSMGMSATSGADGGVRQVPPDPGPHRGGRTP
jgi:tetratricopeptide (TPR) repeat protein